MPISIEKTSRFLNGREWRSFVSAAQSAVSSTGVVRALRGGQAWLTGRTWFGESAAKASAELLVDGGLIAETQESLGV
jgi:hypothetical protein